VARSRRAEEGLLLPARRKIDTSCAQDESQEWSPEAVARKALHGALALGLRQAIVQGLNFVGTIFLAWLFSSSEFGVYAVIAFILSFLIAFGDAGLGASLVRQVEEPSRDDYRSIFTVQQMMVVAVVGVFWLAARQVAQAYHLPA